jgi:SAM-dependent methyltransferase
MTYQRIAEHIEIEWLDNASPVTQCPCCAYTGTVRQYVHIDYQPPEARHHFILQICPSCDVRFVDNTHTMDYFSEILIEIGWHIYQVQVGAGVWPISAPLTRLLKPAGAKVLEIGGAYGFGLDFCIRARGWAGEGFDPSPLAAFGARELGISVTQDYFEDKDVSSGPYDVIVATEVIEHLEHPPEFLALMRRALADDGILVLSTPDAAGITPSLPVAQMMPLLSPGAHIVLQTARSLELALRAAGFADVKIKTGGLSLVAYASPSPFSLNEDDAAARAMYRHYLVERSKLTDELSDLRLGFAGRGYFEACNDGDLAAADAAWAALVPAVRARFGLDLETMTALPAGAENCGLAELCTLMPLGLGMIFFARAMYLLAGQTRRAVLLPLFHLARQSAAALLNAMAKRSLTDGLTASLAGVIELEITLCLAEAGDAACLPALLAAGGSMAWRGFILLVNAGALKLAAQLQSGLGLDMPGPDMPADLRRDVLLSLANLVLAPGGDTPAAFRAALALRALHDEESASAIILQAFARLVNAARYEEAFAAIATYDIDTLARAAGAGTYGHDARLAGVVLVLAAGDPAVVPDMLVDLNLEPAQRGHFLLEAFSRLVNAERYEEALLYAGAHDLAALIPGAGVAGQDAGIAWALAELAAGDPALIPTRIAGLDLPKPRHTELLLAAFTGLVNADRFAEALTYAATHDLAALLPDAGVAGQDAGIAWALAELAAGDPALIPARIAGLALPPERQTELLLAAFTGLVNAGRFAEALTYTATHDLAALLPNAGAAGHDAGIAWALAELAAGDPALIPARISGLALPPERHTELLLAAFTGLVHADRCAEALTYAATHDLAALLPDAGAAGQDAGIAWALAELAAGDPALIPALISGLGLEPSRQTELLLAAFTGLVNADRFAEALTYTATHDLAALLPDAGVAGQDAGIAWALAELAAGDPALIPARIAGLALPPERQTELLLAAFTGLVNAGRFAEALTYTATHDLAALLPNAGAAGHDAGIAWALAELAAGDPALIPARISGLALPPERHTELLLAAFTGLVHADRCAEALTYAATHDLAALLPDAGAAGQDAGIAWALAELAAGDPALIPALISGLGLEPSRQTELLLAAFTGLVNADRFAEALTYAATHDLAALLPDAGVAGQDAGIAWALAELAAGDPALIPARIAGLALPPERQTELLLAAFTGLVNAGRHEDAEALMAAHPKIFAGLAQAKGQAADDAKLAEILLDLQRGRMAQACHKILLLEAAGGPPSLPALYVDGFVRLVNAAQFDAARGIAANRAVYRRLPACPLALRHDGLAALLMLELQPGGNATRVPQLLEEILTAGLERARFDSLVLAAFVTLVNGAQFETARLLRYLADPILLKLRAPYDEAAENALFAAGMLALQTKSECNRAVSLFARLRDDLVKKAPDGAEPRPLFWPALRGEVLALHRLDRTPEVLALLQNFVPAYANAPDDLRAQLGENV